MNDEPNPQGGATPREVAIHLDFAGLQDRALLGKRRVAAFIGLTEKFLEGELPRSLTVPGDFPISLIPDPIPDAMAESLGPEFRQWIIGNCLRELDQFLSLFLDECWDTIQICRIIAEGGLVKPWQRIEGQTNVAKKHKQVLEVAGEFNPSHAKDNEFLTTLSDARNLLSHNLGQVDARRAPDGTMKVRWLNLRVGIKAGDQTFYMDEVGLPFQIPGDEGGTVFIHFDSAEREFRLGERVTLSTAELLQIALGYRIITERVVQALVKYARAAGVAFDDPPPDNPDIID